MGPSRLLPRRLVKSRICRGTKRELLPYTAEAMSAPESGHLQRTGACPPSAAMDGLMRRGKHMSQLGQSRRFNPMSAASGLPQGADIVGPIQLARFVPIGDIAVSCFVHRVRRGFPVQTQSASYTKLSYHRAWPAPCRVHSQLFGSRLRPRLYVAMDWPEQPAAQ
jgi:hypothetical protein